MAETETLKDNPQAIPPRWGAIELLQALSLLIIPFGAFLFPSGWSGLLWLLSVLFFAIPFFLVRIPGTEAKDRQAVDTAAKAPLPDGMRRLEPFHSRRYPGVYHLYQECPEGDNISPENKAMGTGDGKLCDRCQDLMEQGGRG